MFVSLTIRAQTASRGLAERLAKLLPAFGMLCGKEFRGRSCSSLTHARVVSEQARNSKADDRH